MNSFSINAPVLVRFCGKIIPSGAEILKIWGFRKSRRYPQACECKEPSRGRGPLGFSWIIDSNGALLELREIDRRPKTPSWIKPVVNFTKIHYEVVDPKRITLDDLRHLVRGSHGGFKKVVAAAVDRYGVEQVLDREIFMRDIMNEPDLEFSESFVLR